MLDIFTRQWLARRFGALAADDVAIGSLAGVVAAGPDRPALALQCGNGSQHA